MNIEQRNSLRIYYLEKISGVICFFPINKCEIKYIQLLSFVGNVTCSVIQKKAFPSVFLPPEVIADTCVLFLVLSQ